jgi:hypothetical protein
MSLNRAPEHQGTRTPVKKFSLTGALVTGVLVLLLMWGCGGGGGGSAPEPPQTYTVSGTVKYEDKEYSANGFTGKTTYKPVRYAAVDIVDKTIGTLVSGFTDEQGRYSLSAGSTGNLYVRVIAQTNSSSNVKIEIRDLNGNLASVTKSLQINSSTTSLDIDIPAASEGAGAFNIMDIYTAGFQFVNTLSGSYPSQLNVFWQTGSDMGTYYCTAFDVDWCPQGKGIYVKGGDLSGDTDEYDDDVLWHEFGHFIAREFSRDDSLGGIHYLTSNDLDLRLSWSEGWGNFFPTAVKKWLSSTGSSIISTAPLMSLSRYVDTGKTSVYISIDIADPGKINGSDPFIYSSSEMAVAKVLWKLQDSFNMQFVWDVFTSSYLTAASIVNLEAFWDGWLSLKGNVDTITSIFSERAIYYYADGYESDNALPITRKATLGSGESHTLYGADDKDIIPFDASAGTSYSIETYDLKNGADTYLTLLDTNGVTKINENDDQYVVGYEPPNDSTSLSSKITFQPSASGIYYIEVATSIYKPISAGRYGTYTLLLNK